MRHAEKNIVVRIAKPDGAGLVVGRVPCEVTVQLFDLGTGLITQGGALGGDGCGRASEKEKQCAASCEIHHGLIRLFLKR